MELERELRDALENREFFLVYQPTFDLRDMRPTGMEALIRWQHPARGVVQPNDFIPILEETGLISEVGKWVLMEACRQGAKWRETGHRIGMAVNVSGRQLDDDELVAAVGNSLSESGLDPSALTLEITETTLMRNAEDTVRRLAAIKELGVRIAIDDFGTGYSSLSSLRQLPVDILKIAKPFVSGIGDSAADVAFVAAILRLGESLGLTMIAEGVETARQRDLLTSAHCQLAQGFLFGRPMDAEGIGGLLREGRQERIAPLLHVLEA
jgi:EAL domain-containing protein (putative c-di-GMP-specific phosphodiesterase class I)